MRLSNRDQTVMISSNNNLYLFKTRQLFHELKLWFFFTRFLNKIDSAKALTICTG